MSRRLRGRRRGRGARLGAAPPVLLTTSLDDDGGQGGGRGDAAAAAAALSRRRPFRWGQQQQQQQPIVAATPPVAGPVSAAAGVAASRPSQRQRSVPSSRGGEGRRGPPPNALAMALGHTGGATRRTAMSAAATAAAAFDSTPQDAAAAQAALLATAAPTRASTSLPAHLTARPQQRSPPRSSRDRSPPPRSSRDRSPPPRSSRDRSPPPRSSRDRSPPSRFARGGSSPRGARTRDSGLSSPPRSGHGRDGSPPPRSGRTYSRPVSSSPLSPRGGGGGTGGKAKALETRSGRRWVPAARVDGDGDGDKVLHDPQERNSSRRDDVGGVDGGADRWRQPPPRNDRNGRHHAHPSGDRGRDHRTDRRRDRHRRYRDHSPANDRDVDGRAWRHHSRARDRDDGDAPRRGRRRDPEDYDVGSSSNGNTNGHSSDDARGRHRDYGGGRSRRYDERDSGSSRSDGRGRPGGRRHEYGTRGGRDQEYGGRSGRDQEYGGRSGRDQEFGGRGTRDQEFGGRGTRDQDYGGRRHNHGGGHRDAEYGGHDAPRDSRPTRRGGRDDAQLRSNGWGWRGGGSSDRQHREATDNSRPAPAAAGWTQGAARRRQERQEPPAGDATAPAPAPPSTAAPAPGPSAPATTSTTAPEPSQAPAPAPAPTSTTSTATNKHWAASWSTRRRKPASNGDAAPDGGGPSGPPPLAPPTSWTRGNDGPPSTSTVDSGWLPRAFALSELDKLAWGDIPPSPSPSGATPRSGGGFGAFTPRGHVPTSAAPPPPPPATAAPAPSPAVATSAPPAGFGDARSRQPSVGDDEVDGAFGGSPVTTGRRRAPSLFGATAEETGSADRQQGTVMEVKGAQGIIKWHDGGERSGQVVYNVQEVDGSTQPRVGDVVEFTFEQLPFARSARADFGDDTMSQLRAVGVTVLHSDPAPPPPSMDSAIALGAGPWFGQSLSQGKGGGMVGSGGGSGGGGSAGSDRRGMLLPRWMRSDSQDGGGAGGGSGALDGSEWQVGTVVTLKTRHGYGFIQPAGTTERARHLFFQMRGDEIREGDRVRYTVTTDSHNPSKLKAVRVSRSLSDVGVGSAMDTMALAGAGGSGDARSSHHSGSQAHYRHQSRHLAPLAVPIVASMREVVDWLYQAKRHPQAALQSVDSIVAVLQLRTLPVSSVAPLTSLLASSLVRGSPAARTIFTAVRDSAYLQEYKYLGAFAAKLHSMSRPIEAIVDVLTVLSELLDRHQDSAASIDAVLTPLTDAAARVRLPPSQQDALDTLANDTARVLRSHQGRHSTTLHGLLTPLTPSHVSDAWGATTAVALSVPAEVTPSGSAPPRS